MMRVCHLNTCPVGIATQDPELRKRFTGDPQYVVNFMTFVAQEVREHMAQLGFRTFDEMVGHSERLEMRRAIDHWKAHNLDFSRILYQPQIPKTTLRTCQISQEHNVEASLDSTTLIPLCEPALERGERGRGRAADPQRQPRRRHHARIGGHTPLRRRRPPGRHDQAPLPRVGRAELRGLHSQGASP